MADSESTTPKWLLNSFTLALLLVSSNLLAHRTIEPDLWGHIQYGEEWLSTGVLPQTATHTYSSPEHRWINHENLSELTLAIAQRFVGGHGIVIGKVLAGVTVLLLMMRIAMRRGVPAVFAAAMTIPVAYALAEFWLARPQLASFLCAAALCVLLENAFADWYTDGRVRRRWLVPIIPLMIVWVNAHGGFAAGLCILAAYLGLRFLECFRVCPQLWKSHLALFAVIGIPAALTIFINPYGADLVLWMVRSLGEPRPEISEWASMWEAGITIVPFSILTGLTAAAMALTRERRDPVKFIIIGLVTVQAGLHLRHLAFEALLVGFWMPPHFNSAWKRAADWWKSRRPRTAADRPMTPLERLFIGSQAGLTCAALATFLTWKLATFGVDRSEYPVAAIEFINEHQLSGRVVVSFDWAQYTLAALAPHSTVGFDGRFRTCYPQDVIDMTFDFTMGPDSDHRHRSGSPPDAEPDRVLSFGNPNLVLISRRLDRPATRLMAQQADWVLLYQDATAQLWGRSSIYADQASTEFIPPDDRRITNEIPTGIAAWPAFADRSGRMAFAEALSPLSITTVSLDR
jgi:hypothetical protein